MTEWTLSDKITRVGCKSQGVTAIECDKCKNVFSTPTEEIWTHPEKFIELKDVREFIRRVKELSIIMTDPDEDGFHLMHIPVELFDKLAGEKLI